MIARVAQRFAWQSLEDEAVIIDLVTRRVMGLNRSGTFLWTRVDGLRTVGELAAMLAERFGLPTPHAQADTASFIGAMAARGLLVLSAQHP